MSTTPSDLAVRHQVVSIQQPAASTRAEEKDRARDDTRKEGVKATQAEAQRFTEQLTSSDLQNALKATHNLNLTREEKAQVAKTLETFFPFLVSSNKPEDKKDPNQPSDVLA